MLLLLLPYLLLCLMKRPSAPRMALVVNHFWELHQRGCSLLIQKGNLSPEWAFWAQLMKKMHQVPCCRRGSLMEPELGNFAWLSQLHSLILEAQVA